MRFINSSRNYSATRPSQAFRHFAVGTLLTALLSLLLASSANAQTSLTTNYTFLGTSDGHTPMGDLVMDGSGVLYGSITSNQKGGRIYSLTPPAMLGGSWTEQIIYNGATGPFGNPEPLVLGQHGELYSTAHTCAGGFGCVVELVPPVTHGGAWTPKILHLFLGAAQGDGKGVAAGKLAIDASGNLYGATPSGGLADTTTAGTVFELSPPVVSGGAWTETVLYQFQSTGNQALYRPVVGVALGPLGELYGATFAGKLYQLKKQTSTWVATVINSTLGRFSSALTVDASTNLYGVTGNFAHVYQLAPPVVSGGSWTATQIGTSSSGGPGWEVALGPGGAVYGVDPFANEAYKLTLSGGTWTRTVLHTFLGGSEGLQPFGRPLLDSSGHVFGTTETGGSGNCNPHKPPSGCGTAWELQ